MKQPNANLNTPIYDKNFIATPLEAETMYVYPVRRSLQRALENCLDQFSGTIVDLGCGEMPYRQFILDKNKKVKKYIGIDVDFNKHHREAKPDLVWDGKKIPLKNSFADTVISTELFEHLPNIEVVLSEIHRILKKSGILYFTVPFIWPLHETPFDEYRYTPYSLTRHLKNAGFRKINIFPLGGYDAALAEILGIWMCNRPVDLGTKILNNVYVKIEKWLLFAIIRRLVDRDTVTNTTSYGENTMATGFYGYATK